MAGNHLEFEGEVVDVQKGKFKIDIGEGNEIIAQLSGKMRQNKIKVVLGDKVTVKTSPYDPGNGFIVSREKIKNN